MGSWKFLLKSITMTGRGARYNASDGSIVHPRRGEGKVKIKSKMRKVKK